MIEGLEEVKKIHLQKTKVRREQLKKEPQLKQLFLEMTLKCNEHCEHCGSSCGDVPCPEVSFEEYKKLFHQVKRDFNIHKMMLCITGGEPLLRKDFFDIMNYAKSLGFVWGMTSNATLIDDEVANKLFDAGMKTISISIDGLKETHDKFRRLPGAYDRAMDGIYALIRQGGFKEIQVTTVVHRQNIQELDALYEIFKNMDIDSWRVTTIEPIGRARDREDLLLQKEDYIALFDFIKSKREEQMPVTYGCTHYVGLEYEREIRDWYFFCNAGICTASIMSNGDIAACLDIERNARTIQGNIYKDDFTDVWKNRFQIFRNSLAELNENCKNCTSRDYCEGGSYHSWDYDADKPLVCLKGITFE